MTSRADYLELTETELLEELGAILLGDGLGVGGVDPGEAFRVAAKWLVDRSAELKAAVCSGPIVAAVTGNAADDLAIISAALIAHNEGWAAIALPVGAVLLRRGLQTFCAA